MEHSSRTKGKKNKSQVKLFNSCNMTFAGTFQIPTYAISYIEYGDASGLNDLDVELIDGFIDRNFPKGYVVDWHGIDTPYFSSHPEFGLPMDVVDADFYYC